MQEQHPLETKAYTLKPDTEDGIHYDLMHAFEEFKKTNDTRLDALESKKDDILLEEKIDRLNATITEQKKRLDALAVKNARPHLEIYTPITEEKAAFYQYLRSGLETKSFTAGTANTGGYTVPIEIENDISTRLKAISPIRRIADVVQSNALTFRRPFATAGLSAGWVAETGERTTTDTPTLANIDIPAHEIYAMPGATQTLLDDSAVDLDAWIAKEVESIFAQEEGKAFVNGDGSGKPKGFLKYTNALEASWAWGGLGYVKTGVADAMPAADPSDILLDLVYTLKAGYRQNAHFVMNRNTESVIRKFKDDQGNYLWAPPAAPNMDASLFHHPIIDCEDMDNIGANKYPIAFGDFKRGYLIVDRLGTRILRDPYSAKPYVMFYVTKRVGGAVQDFDAIKLLKCEA